jgi:hypothetical protein
MKILDFTVDSVVQNNTKGASVIHIPCGRSVLPSGRAKSGAGSGLAAILVSMLQLRLGTYDWALLPPMHVSWTVANSLPKRVVKKFVYFVSSSSLLSRIFRWIVFGKVKIALVDNSDQLSPSISAIEMFAPELYFMVNAPAALVGKRLPWGLGHTLLLRIPMMIDETTVERLAPARANSDRPNDVFITGVYHHPQRKKQLEAALILQQRGKKVFELQERGFEKFSDGMARAKFCFAGQGLGYYSIRMAEVVAAGAVPIINEPDEAIDHSFRHGENAIVYSSCATAEEIADAVERVLDDSEMITTIRVNAWNALMKENMLTALADKVIEYLKSA